MITSYQSYLDSKNPFTVSNVTKLDAHVGNALSI